MLNDIYNVQKDFKMKNSFTVEMQKRAFNK